MRELRLCYEVAGYLNSALIYLNRNLFSHAAKKSATFITQNNSFLASKPQHHGAGNAGVETGGFRRCVACSKPKASFINSGSAHARPRSSIPTGTPIGASAVGVEKPAGTSMAGNPARAAITPLRSF